MNQYDYQFSHVSSYLLECLLIAKQNMFSPQIPSGTMPNCTTTARTPEKEKVDTKPTSGSMTLSGGLVLNYSLFGQGPLLLCIVGSTGLASIFRHIIPYFAKEYTLCLYDRRGFSSTSEGISLVYHRDWQPHKCVHTNAEDAAILIQRLSPNSPAFVLSNAFGAVIALDLIVHHPDLVHAAIIHEPWLVSGLPEPWQFVWKSAIDDILEAFEEEGEYAAVEEFLAAFMTPVADDVNRSRVLYWDPTRPETLHNSFFALRVELPAARDYVLDIQRLSEHAKKLVLCGGEDTAQEGRPHRVAKVLGRQLDCMVKTVIGSHTTFADPRYVERWSEEILLHLRAYPVLRSVEVGHEDRIWVDH